MNETAKPLSEMTLEELWQLFPIILSGHDPAWHRYYEEGKVLLEKAFGGLLVRIEHIGSTAVEGLIAEPTVDILLEADPSASPEAGSGQSTGTRPIENGLAKTLRTRP